MGKHCEPEKGNCELSKRCRTLHGNLNRSSSEHRKAARVQKRNSSILKNKTSSHNVERGLSTCDKSRRRVEEKSKSSRRKVRPLSPEAQAWKGRYKSEPMPWAVLESQCPDIAETVHLTKTGEILVDRYTGTHRNSYLLGSAESCEIRLDNEYADPKHCVFYRIMSHSENTWVQRVFVADRGPTGVWVNGVKLPVHGTELLQEDDIISFCDPENAPSKSVKYRLKAAPSSLVSLEEHSIDEMYSRSGLIGKGTFGTVSYAICRRTFRKFALKIARLTCDYDIKVIYQEIAVHMSIQDHPNIIQLERVVVFGNTFHMIMELGNNGDLFEFVQETRLAEDEIRIIFDQIVHALDYLHDQEITHRDLKLENIIVANKEKLIVKLGDFGLSRFSSSERPLTTLCGTSLYFAPEIVPLHGPVEYTKAIDIWCLGVMLYTVFTMSMPFSVENPESEAGKEELQAKIRSDEPDYDPRVWRVYSTEAKDLVQSMIVKDPKKRLTIDKIIAHPWFNNIENERTKLKGLERCAALKEFLEMKK